MSSPNSDTKSPEDLTSAIPQDHASLFQNMMDGSSPVNGAVLRCTLAHPPEDRFVATISHSTSVLPGHLRHHDYVLGAHDSTKAISSEPVNDGTIQRQNANDAAILSGEELRAGLRKLPKEICDAIESAFIKSTLAPGFIFPDQAPGPNGKYSFNGEYFEPTRYEVLLGLNRANYLLRGSQFWSNFFVIGNGPAHDSMRWLRRMHKDVRAKIRKVYISLSRDDKPGEGDTSEKNRAFAAYSQGADYDPLDLMYNFDNHTVNYETALRWGWIDKLSCLQHLKLENLIIDVRDASGLDDSFLDNYFMYMAPRFTKPQSVKVIANDDASAASLLSIFLARNP